MKRDATMEPRRGCFRGVPDVRWISIAAAEARAVQVGLMRVLFLSTWFPFPLSQGSKIRAYHLIKAIARNHDSALVSFADTQLDQSWADHMRQFCSQVRLVERDPFATSSLGNIRGWFSLHPSFVRSAYSKEMASVVRQFSSQWRPDRIVVFTFVAGPYALAVDDVTRVIDVDNFMSRMMFEAYQEAIGVNAKARRYLAWRKFLHYEKWLYHRFDRCLAVTSHDRALMGSQLGLDPDRICVIPNGVDTVYNRPTDDPPDRYTLVFNGSLMYDANYDAMMYFLREVFPAIYDRCPCIKLTITGKHDGVPVDRLPHAERVKFTGYLDDIRPVVRRSWACIAPIRMGGGTRLKILEAMALGTPVVSTSKGAEGLGAIPGEHLLVADDPREFAEKTISLLDDLQLRQSLSIHASKFVQDRYEWKMIGERFESIVGRSRF